MREQSYLENNKKCIEKMQWYFGPTIEQITSMENSSEPECIRNEEICIEEIRSNNILLIVNEQSYKKIQDLNQKIGNVLVCPIYLYFDIGNFIKFIKENSITGIEDVDRFVLIVGRDEFITFFQQYDVMKPSLILGDVSGEFREKIENLYQKKDMELAEMQREVEQYYNLNEKEIQQRIENGTYRICILKYTFEPLKFKKLYIELQKALDNDESSVVICNERGYIFRTPVILNIYKYKPDIVFQINKRRDGKNYLGESVKIEHMENLIYINWLQDIHPAVLSSMYEMGKYDYAFSLFDKNMLRRYQFPEEHIIYHGIMSANEQMCGKYEYTDEERKKYECDICFVGSVIDSAGLLTMTYEMLKPYMEETGIFRVLEEMIDMLGRIYDAATGTYIVNDEQIINLIDRLQSELSFDDYAKSFVYRAFSVARYNTMRELILKQLAEQKKYRIILYGECDPEIAGVEYGGFLADTSELAKALQAAKITMQINPDATMNQRVLESLLSKTMVLVFQIKEEYDVSNVKQYLEEGEGIAFFTGKGELINWCDRLIKDDELRNFIAQKGFQKVKTQLTQKVIYEHMIEDLQKKILQR